MPTGASSKARRKRVAAVRRVAARVLVLAPGDDVGDASAATKAPWMPAQRHGCVRRVVEDRPARSAPIEPCWKTTKRIASRYAHHSS